MMNPADVRYRLLDLYADANQSEREDGKEWYPKYQKVMQELATNLRYPLRVVANVHAALSPQLDWPRNLLIAENLLTYEVPSVKGALQVNIEKAKQIRDNAILDTREVFKVAPKVHNFSLNLSGDMNAVTLDTHMVQAMCGDPLLLRGYRTWKAYDGAADTLRGVAREVDLSPAAFQATLWLTWKRMYPTSWKQQHARGGF